MENYKSKYHNDHQEAANLLASAPVGTFLLRNSQSQNCEYALSLKDPHHGPTSIRFEPIF